MNVSFPQRNRANGLLMPLIHKLFERNVGDQELRHCEKNCVVFCVLDGSPLTQGFLHRRFLTGRDVIVRYALPMTLSISISTKQHLSCSGTVLTQLLTNEFGDFVPAHMLGSSVSGGMEVESQKTELTTTLIVAHHFNR